MVYAPILRLIELVIEEGLFHIGKIELYAGKIADHDGGFHQKGLHIGLTQRRDLHPRVGGVEAAQKTLHLEMRVEDGLIAVLLQQRLQLRAGDDVLPVPEVVTLLELGLGLPLDGVGAPGGHQQQLALGLVGAQQGVKPTQTQPFDNTSWIMIGGFYKIPFFLQGADEKVGADVGVVIPFHVVDDDPMLQKGAGAMDHMELVEHVVAVDLRGVAQHMGADLHFRCGAEQIVLPAAVGHDPAQRLHPLIVRQGGVCHEPAVQFRMLPVQVGKDVVAVVPRFAAPLGDEPDMPVILVPALQNGSTAGGSFIFQEFPQQMEGAPGLSQQIVHRRRSFTFS